MWGVDLQDEEEKDTDQTGGGDEEWKPGKGRGENRLTGVEREE